MKLHIDGANRTRIVLAAGDVLFFSYETLVAVRAPAGNYFRSTDRHSNTTQKHLTQWGVPKDAEKRPQAWFDSLAFEV